MIQTMPGNLQPLDQKFPIVKPDGKPTDYFIRWAQQRQIDIGDGISAAEAAVIIQQYLADNYTVQEILDQITSVRGSVLFRGATDWQALAPGTAGQVLSTNGAGADPTWAAGGSSEIFDFPIRDAAPVAETIGRAAKAHIVRPLVDLSVTELVCQFTSQVSGGTYEASIITLDVTLDTILTIEGTSSTYTAATTAAGFVLFPFSSPITLTAGVKYGLMITRTGVAGTTILTIDRANGFTQFATSGLVSEGWAGYSTNNPPIVNDTANTISTSNGLMIGIRYTA